jgi:DNA mismatch repair protein MutS
LTLHADPLPGRETAHAASPLIQQYAALKAEYPEALLLSRVGDFYEAYGADAEDLAHSLHILLTSKESGKGTRVAMAGVPHHSVDAYLARLLRQRRVVAIAEQMEQPVPNKLVRREIVRVLTPGTVVEDQFLQPDRNNYLCAVGRAGGTIAVARADVSTAQCIVTMADDDDQLAAELDRIDPAEVVVGDAADEALVSSAAGPDCRVTVERVHDKAGDLADRAVAALDLARAEREPARAALDLLARFLSRVRIDAERVLLRARVHAAGDAMLLDQATRRHLDLLKASGANSAASMLGAIAKNRTPMGGRLLAARLSAPLVDVRGIRERLDRVQRHFDRPSSRLQLQEILARIGDVERIVQKVQARRVGARDLAALRRSLAAADELRAPLERLEGNRIDMTAVCGDGAPAQLRAELERAIVDEPPALIGDGGSIRPDYDADLRELIDLANNGRRKLVELEAATRARTGIRSLRIKYTQAFGYYYEIPKAHADSAPMDFARRSSLVNAERFTNVDLKELESAILTSRSRQIDRERIIFESLLREVDACGSALLAMSAAVAALDVDCCLAQVAGERGFVRPEIVDERVIEVEAGRHPVVEAFGEADFVANDCDADDEKRFLLITGPNMGGKSTYLRQTALISVLAQMGSFVPARRARLGVVDRLFTRIGAGDDIAAGRSTFFVEMSEMADILRRCTARSLLLIDEVGRGTGTTDGLAIAQSICEYLLGLDDAMPIVLFATHFHELVHLAAAFPVVENLHVMVADGAAGPVFSHKVLHGASSRSYGIAVGQMAGLPREVVDRARQIADELECRPEPRPRAPKRRNPPDEDQMKLGL